MVGQTKKGLRKSWANKYALQKTLHYLKIFLPVCLGCSRQLKADIPKQIGRQNMGTFVKYDS